MASQFSKDGKYFAQISLEGKVKIWNTVSSTLEQEFTPDFHLTTPCTCLHFIQNDFSNKGATPKKKKRRESYTNTVNIVLGTNTGILLVYSLTKADVKFIIDSKTGSLINCLSCCDENIVYSGVENNVFMWNLQQQSVINKWVGGNDKISAILAIPDSNKLLTASKNIKLWDIENQEVLNIFTGHCSQVTFLQYINLKSTCTDSYFISGSSGDRILSCWKLGGDGKAAVANFLMQDTICSASIFVSTYGPTTMAATVRSGVVHVYQHTLNGKCNKPLKPKTTIQIIADSGENKEQVTPIQINGAIYRDENTLCIVYGTLINVFENIEITYNKKMLCYLRKDPQMVEISKNKHVSKIRKPIINNDVHYLTPQTSIVTSKRKHEGQKEIPMEKRLENLTLNKLDGNSKVPKADNVAQLLVQGLYSKDKNILRTVLTKRDEDVIKNTIKRLPMQVIIPLIEELTNFISGKTLSSLIGSLWLRNLILVHAALLLSNPHLSELLGPTLASIETRLALQSPLNKLRGRLDLLSAQVDCVTNEENNVKDEALLVFDDKMLSDSDDNVLDFEVQSESENDDWYEESGGDEEQDDLHENVDNNDRHANSEDDVELDENMSL